jgi:hypothetical protein
MSGGSAELIILRYGISSTCARPYKVEVSVNVSPGIFSADRRLEQSAPLLASLASSRVSA